MRCFAIPTPACPFPSTLCIWAAYGVQPVVQPVDRSTQCVAFSSISPCAACVVSPIAAVSPAGASWGRDIGASLLDVGHKMFLLELYRRSLSPCVLYLQLFGGQFHFTFPLNPRGFGKYNTSFYHNVQNPLLYTNASRHDSFPPNIRSIPFLPPHRFFCCCQPASSSVRAASAFFLSDSGPVPIVIPRLIT